MSPSDHPETTHRRAPLRPAKGGSQKVGNTFQSLCGSLVHGQARNPILRVGIENSAVHRGVTSEDAIPIRMKRKRLTGRGDDRLRVPARVSVRN